jgi:hypothetical protein
MSGVPAVPTLRFLGAAGTVTGSKFLVETTSARAWRRTRRTRRRSELGWTAVVPEYLEKVRLD